MYWAESRDYHAVVIVDKKIEKLKTNKWKY